MTEQAEDILRSTRSLLVLTGAGISAESGLPTYRGPAGAYTTSPDLPTILSATGLAQNPLRVWQYIDEFRVLAAQAQPNQAHRILARWEQENTFDEFLIATQNIDGLHQAAGNTRVTQLHGSVWQMASPRELEYTEDENFDREAQEYLAGNGREAILRRWSEANDQTIWEDRTVPFPYLPPYADPAIRPNVMFFDEAYGSRLLWVNDFICRKPDTVLVVGCSGTVSILAKLISDCQRANPDCKIINVNVHDDPIGCTHVHLPLTATAGLAALDVALRDAPYLPALDPFSAWRDATPQPLT